MRERAFLFGESKSLVGVITEPAAEADGRPAVVILNAGLIHRVGPNRLHVTLARRLAREGFPVLRFDLSGIGDSKTGRDKRSFLDVAVGEARQAMDFLQSSRGIDRFVLAGICSGADNALRVACADERVSGAVLVEGFAVALPGFFFYHHRKNLMSPRSWWRLIAGRSETWAAVRSAAAAHRVEDEVDPTRWMAQPDPRQLLEDLRALRRRDVNLCFLYSSESPAYYSYRRLLHRRVRAGGGRGVFRSEAVPGSDHVFTRISDQQRVVDVVCEWALAAYSR